MKGKKQRITQGRSHPNIAEGSELPGNQGFATLPDYDFSEWLVPGAELPGSEPDYSVLQERFGRMLVGSFEQQREQAGRDTVLDAWDECIFDSIQEYGPLVLLSRSVVRRIFTWQFDGNCIPKLLRLGKELAKAAQIRHRAAKGRITPKHVAFKRFATEELALLRTKVVEAWPKDELEIRAFIAAELEFSNCPYPNLARNMPSLIGFLTTHGDVAIRFRGTLKPSGGRTKGLSDDVGPARFVNLWIAHVENKTEDSVRQELWRQGK